MLAMKPSIPYKPLPKITARIAPEESLPSNDRLQVGDTVQVLIIPKHFGGPPAFWRDYRVTIIDGETCRLVSFDGKHAENHQTKAVKELRDLLIRCGQLP
jgi:hypothetical protein